VNKVKIEIEIKIEIEVKIKNEIKGIWICFVKICTSYSPCLNLIQLLISFEVWRILPKSIVAAQTQKELSIIQDRKSLFLSKVILITSNQIW